MKIPTGLFVAFSMASFFGAIGTWSSVATRLSQGWPPLAECQGFYIAVVVGTLVLGIFIRAVKQKVPLQLAAVVVALAEILTGLLALASLA
jgi:hypothetical protein